MPSPGRTTPLLRRLAVPALALPLLAACTWSDEGCVTPEALHAAAPSGVAYGAVPGAVGLEPGTTMWAQDADLSADGTRLVVACDGETCQWDTTTGRLVDPLPVVGEHTAWAGDVLVGTGHASGEEEGEVRLADGDDTCVLRGLDVPFATDGGSGLSALAVHPDGGLLATGAVDGRVGLWSVAGRERLDWLDVDLPDPSALAWSPGTLLAVGGSDGPAEIWSADPDDGPEQRLTLDRPLTRLAWSPDGERLAGVDDDGLALWDVATWEPAGEVDLDGVTDLAWSPDSSRLAVVRPDEGTVEVVDPTTGDAVVVARHDDPPQSVLWAPDGSALYSVDGVEGVRRTPISDGRPTGEPRTFEAPAEIGA